jgi:DNA-binding NarL/FixJ family response regulator
MPDPQPLRIVLADDHALLLEGLRTLIGAEPDLRVVATATDGERLLEAVWRFRPDVAVVDPKMLHGRPDLHPQDPGRGPRSAGG